MKKIGLFLIFLFSALLLSAQDIIVKNSGETIKAYNLEASGTSVFFQLSAEPDAPLQKLPKTEILVVRKADGTKLDFDAPQPAAQQQTATVQNKPIKLTLDMLSDEEMAENERLIKQYNEPVEFTFKKEGKEASTVYACFSPKRTSIITNKDISISLVTGRMTSGSRSRPAEFQEWSPLEDDGWSIIVNHFAALKITNKTDQTIYVDLGNTMLVVQGRSIPFYVPQTTTTSNTSVGGGGVNLGALTGSSLLGGISLGGGNASSTVSTVFSQRVVAIAPYGTLQTPAVSLWGSKGECHDVIPGIKWDGVSYNPSLDIYLPKKSLYGGMVVNYNEENAPLNISAYISYAYTEDCSQERTLPIHYFLKHLIGKSPYRGFMKFTKFPCVGTGLNVPYIKKSYPGDYFPLP